MIIFGSLKDLEVEWLTIYIYIYFIGKMMKCCKSRNTSLHDTWRLQTEAHLPQVKINCPGSWPLGQNNNNSKAELRAQITASFSPSICVAKHHHELLHNLGMNLGIEVAELGQEICHHFPWNVSTMPYSFPFTFLIHSFLPTTDSHEWACGRSLQPSSYSVGSDSNPEFCLISNVRHS